MEPLVLCFRVVLCMCRALKEELFSYVYLGLSLTPNIHLKCIFSHVPYIFNPFNVLALLCLCGYFIFPFTAELNFNCAKQKSTDKTNEIYISYGNISNEEHGFCCV